MICPGPIRLCPAQNDQKGVRATTAKSGNLVVWVFCGIPRAGELTITRRASRLPLPIRLPRPLRRTDTTGSALSAKKLVDLTVRSSARLCHSRTRAVPSRMIMNYPQCYPQCALLPLPTTLAILQRLIRHHRYRVPRPVAIQPAPLSKMQPPMPFQSILPPSTPCTHPPNGGYSTCSCDGTTLRNASRAYRPTLPMRCGTIARCHVTHSSTCFGREAR